MIARSRQILINATDHHVQLSCNPYRYKANDYCIFHVLNIIILCSKVNIVVCIAFNKLC